MLMNFISHISKVIFDFLSSLVTQVNLFPVGTVMPYGCAFSEFGLPYSSTRWPLRSPDRSLIENWYDEKQTVKCVYCFSETNMSFDEAHFQNGKS